MQDTQCSDTWTGHQSSYQSIALDTHRRATGRSQLPWTWVVTACATPMCLDAKHMRMRTPVALRYPPGVCCYCGFPADTRDHLIPRPMSGDDRRSRVLTVPACRECNSAIQAKGGYRISERREIAQDHLRRKHRILLQTQDRTPAQLKTYGPTLRSYIRANMRLRAAVRSRLAWPEDLDYDDRAFAKAGIPADMVPALV